MHGASLSTLYNLAYVIGDTRSCSVVTTARRRHTQEHQPKLAAWILAYNQTRCFYEFNVSGTRSRRCWITLQSSSHAGQARPSC